MNQRLPKRVLISGLGSIGRRYCRLIQKFWPGIELAALRSGQAKKVIEENYLTQSFISIDEALTWNPDACIISGPANVHIGQSLQFARRQIPLLIEKPIGTGFEEPVLRNELLDLATSVPIYVGYVLRQDPCAETLRDLLVSEELGSLIAADFFCGSWLPSWRPGQDYRESASARRDLGGGVLLELSHELDMAQWLLGPLNLLNAFSHNSGVLDIDVEDQAHLLVQNQTGSPISFRLDFCTNPARRVISLRFEKAELVWDLLLGIVTKTDVTQCVSRYQRGATPDDRFWRQLELFWQYPNPDQSTLCSVQEAFKTLDLIVQARQLAIEKVGCC